MRVYRLISNAALIVLFGLMPVTKGPGGNKSEAKAEDLLSRASELISEGKKAEAREKIITYADLSPSNWSSLLEKTVELRDKQQYKSARFLLAAISESRHSVDAEISYQIGMNYMQEALSMRESDYRDILYRKSRQFFKDARSSGYKTDDCDLQLARIHVNRGEYREACRLSERIERARPDNPEAKITLGVATWKSGNSEYALRLLREAYKLAENNQLKSEALFYEGMLVHMQGYLVEALDCYTRCISMNPQMTQAYLGRAELAMRAGQYSVAKSDLETALKLGSTIAGDLLDEVEARLNKKGAEAASNIGSS